MDHRIIKPYVQLCIILVFDQVKLQCPPQFDIHPSNTEKFNGTCLIRTWIRTTKQISVAKEQIYSYKCGIFNWGTCYRTRTVYRLTARTQIVHINTNSSYTGTRCIENCKLKDKSCICYCPNISFGEKDQYGIYKTSDVVNSTQTGQSIRTPCKYGGGNVIGSCIMQNKKTKWLPFNFSSCYENPASQLESLAKVNVSNNNVEEVSDKLKTLVKSSSLQNNSINTPKHQDVDNVAVVIANLLNTTNSNKVVNENVLEVIDSVGQLNRTVLSEATFRTAFLDILTTIASGSLSTENSNTSFQYSGTTIALTAVSFPEFVDKDVLISVSNTEYGNLNVNLDSALNVSNDNFSVASIRLPSEIFSKGEAKVFSYAYKSSVFFVGLNDSDEQYVNSIVLSATILNRTVKNLNNSVLFEFDVVDKERKNECAFWQFAEQGQESGKGKWSTRGCTTLGIIHENGKEILRCSCDHLTSFAAIFGIEEVTMTESSSSSVELTIISYIGVSLSLFTLSLTLITYLSFKRLRSKTPQKILINLCISLLLLLATFMVAMEPIQNVNICTAVASLLQCFLLSTFAWMGVQGISLYKKVVKATRNRGNNPKFFWVCFCFGWGIPILITTITKLVLDPEKIQKTCILVGKNIVYTTVIPIGVVMIFNILIFFPIIKEIHSHLLIKDKFQNKKKDLLRRALTTLSCSLLLGLSWSFGFLMVVNEMRYVFELLFCIFNSLQGFFIFIFHVVRNEEAKNQWKQLCCKKTRQKQRSSTEDSTKSGTMLTLSTTQANDHVQLQTVPPPDSNHHQNIFKQNKDMK